jgi:hypothetical protein
MKTSPMMNQHQIPAPWEWSLARASATRLRPCAVPRWLRVSAGRAWLTQSGGGPQSDDVWLSAGQRHLLPAGTDWVAEGWPEARVEVLEAPSRGLSATASAPSSAPCAA